MLLAPAHQAGDPVHQLAGELGRHALKPSLAEVQPGSMREQLTPSGLRDAVGEVGKLTGDTGRFTGRRLGSLGAAEARECGRLAGGQLRVPAQLSACLSQRVGTALRLRQEGLTARLEGEQLLVEAAHEPAESAYGVLDTDQDLQTSNKLLPAGDNGVDGVEVPSGQLSLQRGGAGGEHSTDAPVGPGQRTLAVFEHRL